MMVAPRHNPNSPILPELFTTAHCPGARPYPFDAPPVTVNKPRDQSRAVRKDRGEHAKVRECDGAMAGARTTVQGRDTADLHTFAQSLAPTLAPSNRRTFAPRAVLGYVIEGQLRFAINNE